jgi:Uma2 family endonuclease
MAVRTESGSVRYPDVTVFCGHDDADDDGEKAFDDPKVIFEVLSAGTSRTDLRVKLPEYQALPSVDTIVFVDVAKEVLRVVQRTGTNGWSDQTSNGPIDITLPSVGIVLPHDEIFARD